MYELEWQTRRTGMDGRLKALSPAWHIGQLRPVNLLTRCLQASLREADEMLPISPWSLRGILNPGPP